MVSNPADILSLHLYPSPYLEKPQVPIVVQVVQQKDEPFFMGITQDAVANGICTLLGAVVGGILAYKAQRWFQLSRDKELRLTAAHKMIFSIGTQINGIVLLQRDQVFPHLDDPLRFISIPAVPPRDMNDGVLDISELGFLLETHEGRLLLFDFNLAQQSYRHALQQVNLRSEIHINRLQPHLGDSVIKPGQSVTFDEVREDLGLFLYETMLNSTNNCIGSLKQAYRQLASVQESAIVFLKAHFPKQKFMKVKVQELYRLDDPSQDDGVIDTALPPTQAA